MPVLYVTKPGAKVRQKGGRVRVEWQGQRLSELPIRELERLVLMGPVQLSAEATRLLLKAEIPVLFCTLRGRNYGTLSPGHQDVELLMAQIERYQDAAYRLEKAKTIVEIKIRHQQRLLRRHARNHPLLVLTEAVERLDSLLSELTSSTTVPQVMGMEGWASNLYFSAFGACLRKEGVSFSGRSRRPPKDPVNAVLSLGYMLVLQEVLTAIMSQGLHPGIGFLHEVSRRHPALVLDLLELARQPIVDRLTISLFNLGALTPEDFHQHEGGGVRLKEDSLKRYLQFYERAMTTPFRNGQSETTSSFRDWLLLQAEQLRKAVQENRPWTLAALEL